MARQDTPRFAAESGRLTRSSAGTLHHQLYSTLSEMISRGVVKPGDRLPTEAELVETYRVSRTTARRAVDELRRAGLVERQPGRGTFVLPPRLQASIPYLHSITEEIEKLGFTPGVVPISVTSAAADETAAERLQLQVGDPLLVVKRVRTADGRPVFVSESTLNIMEFPQLADADYSKEGMYTVFERVLGRRLSTAKQWLSAVSASKDVAENLQVRRGAPVLQLERIVYLDDGRPVEIARGFFHGQIYKYYSELERPL